MDPILVVSIDVPVRNVRGILMKCGIPTCFGPRANPRCTKKICDFQNFLLNNGISVY